MEQAEYISWVTQQEYWQQKVYNAQLENDYWTLKIQKLKNGDETVD